MLAGGTVELVQILLYINFVSPKAQLRDRDETCPSCQPRSLDEVMP